jgi:hypothetical protein
MGIGEVGVLFGIGHKCRQGKDVMGAYLSENYGFHVTHFADALKREAERVGWDPNNANTKNVSAREFYTKLMNEYGCAPREILAYPNEIVAQTHAYMCDHPIADDSATTFLQWYGTEFRRAQDPDYWVARCFENILAHVSSFSFSGMRRVAICDMRFVSEYRAIQGTMRRAVTGFFPIRVTFDVCRLNEDSTPFVADDRDPTHPSECQLDCIPHDFKIRARSVEELHAHIDSIMLFLDIPKTK